MEQPTELPNVNVKPKLGASKSDIGIKTNEPQASPKSPNQVNIFDNESLSEENGSF